MQSFSHILIDQKCEQTSLSLAHLLLSLSRCKAIYLWPLPQELSYVRSLQQPQARSCTWWRWCD